MDHIQTSKHSTHNLSPSKSPNATIRSPSTIPIEPASMREFFVNRLGGNGHIDATGDESSMKLSARYTGTASNG